MVDLWRAKFCQTMQGHLWRGCNVWPWNGCKFSLSRSLTTDLKKICHVSTIFNNWMILNAQWIDSCSDIIEVQFFFAVWFSGNVHGECTRQCCAHGNPFLDAVCLWFKDKVSISTHMLDYVSHSLLCKHFMQISFILMLLFSREKLWELLLHDAVLSLCCYEDDDSMLVRTFAGLADGTLAVTEVTWSVWILRNTKILIKCNIHY